MPVISVRRHLYGDLSLPKGTPLAHRIAWNRFLRRLAAAARSVNQRWEVLDGYRPYDDQVRLWNLYKAGRGNLAAVPGTSNHGFGEAADVYAYGSAVGNSKRRAKALKRYGLCLPVRGEKWHVERGNRWRAVKEPA